MLNAFDKLTPNAFKADFARYLLIYKLGGWYFDISIKATINVNVGADVDMLVFADRPQFSYVSFACNQAIFYSKAGNPVLLDCINQILEHIETNYYGNNRLDVTGPNLFGQMVAKNSTKQTIVSGMFMDLTPGYAIKNTAFLLNSGEIIAFYKRANSGDLSALGAEGTNNYNQLYHQRMIYDQNIPFKTGFRLNK